MPLTPIHTLTCNTFVMWKLVRSGLQIHHSFPEMRLLLKSPTSTRNWWSTKVEEPTVFQSLKKTVSCLQLNDSFGTWPGGLEWYSSHQLKGGFFNVWSCNTQWIGFVLFYFLRTNLKLAWVRKSSVTLHCLLLHCTQAVSLDVWAVFTSCKCHQSGV